MKQSNTVAQTRSEKPIKHEHGYYYYPTLPHGWRIAKLKDFYQGAKLIINKPFLIHTWHSKVFECYRTRSGFPVNENTDVRIWLNQNRVYVLDD